MRIRDEGVAYQCRVLAHVIPAPICAQQTEVPNKDVQVIY